LEVWLEFTGIAKTITKNQRVSLSVQNGTTITDLVKILAQDYPGLCGLVINPEGTGLLNSNVFFINGETLVLPDRMDQNLCDGDHLTLLSVIVGGNEI
jgi:sulfur carrier protein ThiS